MEPTSCRGPGVQIRSLHFTLVLRRATVQPPVFSAMAEPIDEFEVLEMSGGGRAVATAHEAFDEDAASVLLLQRLVMAARAIPSFSIATSLVLRRRWRVRARRASSWLTRRPSCCLLVGSRRVVMSRRCALRRRARPLRIVVSKAVDAAESLRSRLSSEHPERLPSA